MSATDNSRTKPAHNPHSCGGRLLDAARPGRRSGWRRMRGLIGMRSGWCMFRSDAVAASLSTLPAGRFRRQAVLVFAATSLLVAIACGANVPTKPEAAAALSKAIESTLKRTLPSSTYCMTANPDFSFKNMGQMDLVETFQNLKDKSPLYDAATAGVVRIELKEFRYDPAGRSPDPSCDALHAQSRQNGYTSGQVRLAVVRTTLTPKATAAGVQLDRPIDIATRELLDVTDVRSERGGAAAVKYTWRWKPTKMADAIGYTPPAPQEATARFRRSDSGWVVENTGVK